MHTSGYAPLAVLVATPATQALRSLSVLTLSPSNLSADIWLGEKTSDAATCQSRLPHRSLPAELRIARQGTRLSHYGPPACGLAASPFWPRGTRSYAAQPEAKASLNQQADQPPAEAQEREREQGRQKEGGAQQQHRQQQSPPPDPAARPPHDVVYAGPLSQQHKLLKRISITNTLVAVGAAPAIVAFADNISMVSRYGLATSLVFFGLITTGALHWVAHPYVHELRYTAATGQIDVRTTTLLGNSRWHSFNVDDVQPLPWNRPVATFTARGQFYYIDVFSFPDEALLRRLTPDAEDVPQGYKDKDDDDD